MQGKLLEVENLQVYYGGIHALCDLSLFCEPGEIVSIIGANGAGKSTLLRTLAGDKDYRQGRIVFDGQPLPPKAYLAAERGICLVPEGRRIFVNLTVKENLRIGAFLEKKKSVRFEEVYSIFPRLKEREKQMGGTLSGGEQQMLAVGRAMMARPKLMMLDEPSLGLAPIVIDEMFEKFQEINKKLGISILLVEQNAYIALETAMRAYVLKLGKIVKEGSGRELLQDPDVQKAYMGVR